MIRAARRVSLLIAVAVLVSAAPASACWLLWHSAHQVDGPLPPFEILDVLKTRAACVDELNRRLLPGEDVKILRCDDTTVAVVVGPDAFEWKCRTWKTSGVPEALIHFIGGR